MQAQREAPPSLTDVKDKFLVQYCTVAADVREVEADFFDGALSKDLKQTKLRVVLVRCHWCNASCQCAVPSWTPHSGAAH